MENDKSLVLNKIEKSDYKKPEKRNLFIPDKIYESIDKTCEKGICITERGEVVVHQDAFKELFRVKKKTEANFIYENQISEENKKIFNSEKYATSSSVVGLLDKKSQEVRDTKISDELRYSRDSLINVGDSDKAESIRRKFDSFAQKELKKLKSKRGTTNDEITGKPLTKGSAFHHDEMKAINTSLDNLLNPDKGINVNQDTHNVIHKLGIMTKEERIKRNPEILEELSKNNKKKM